jgi:hypothetical protein
MGQFLRSLTDGDNRDDIRHYVLDPAVEYVLGKVNPYFYAMGTLLFLMIVVLFYVAFIKQFGGITCTDCHRRVYMQGAAAGG